MDIFRQIIDWLGGQLDTILSWITYLLPPSPFSLLENSPISEYIGYINYFVPIDFMVNTLTAWGAAVLVFYSYHVILRWAKAIE